MGRQQSFDTDAVVRAARTLFWEHGYEGASVPDLERATGLNRSSIYHAFGSKRGLFDAAVESYLDEVVRPRLRGLRADAVAPDAILTYLTGLRRALGSGIAATHGCLLVNAAGAPIAHDAAVAETVAAYRGELRDAFARGIAARRRDSAPAGPDVETLAEACTALVLSAFAITRVDNAAALRTVDAALRLVA